MHWALGGDWGQKCLTVSLIAGVVDSQMSSVTGVGDSPSRSLPGGPWLWPCGVYLGIGGSLNPLQDVAVRFLPGENVWPAGPELLSSSS